MTDAKQKYEPSYPSHSVYHVTEGKRGFWTKIGAAWEHKDGEGFNVELDLVPIRAGRIVLRKFEQPSEDSSQQEAA